jgi:type I restriction enzyme S subunit
MIASAPRVPFREIMRPNQRPYMLAPDEDANLVGMRLYGEGPFHRELKPAISIMKKSHFLIREGDVIYNKLFAWKGTFGIVPPELDGMYVSDKFPTYELDKSRVSHRYLAWFFRHPGVWDQARAMSTGSAALSKLTLNPPRFLDLILPLPDLAEQERTVDWLEGLAARVSEASALRASAQGDFTLLSVKSRDAILSSVAPSGSLGDVLNGAPRNGWSPVCDNDDNGTPVLTLSAVTGWRFNANAYKRTSLPTRADAHYWAAAGDLLMTRSNTPELVGHVAIHSGRPNPCIYPDLMMKLPLDKRRADTSFVWYWLQSTMVRSYIKRSAKGTSPTMKKISQPIVEAIPFPVHLSIDQQTDMVAKLDASQEKLDAARALQAETASELDAMVPTILDKAFKGELS